MKISEAFLTKVSEVLADTNMGLSGPQIIRYMSDFAVDFGVDIPYASYPFPKELPNKRTALKDNIKAFDHYQQFKIIVFLCELDVFTENKAVQDIKVKLFEQYEELNVDSIVLDTEVLSNTRHWLKEYPESLKLYNDAVRKYELDIFKRNLLDDLRLSLEKLLCKLFDNNKSFENQLSELGTFLKEQNVSPQLRNMFIKIIDYYSKYHNDHVKHDDAVNEIEVEIILELTSSMMKFLVRVKNGS